jgi:hypothetical protein
MGSMSATHALSASVVFTGRMGTRFSVFGFGFLVGVIGFWVFVINLKR